MTRKPELSRIATDLEQLANRIRTEGPSALAITHEWSMLPTANADGPRSKGGHSDPVEAVAVLPAGYTKGMGRPDPDDPRFLHEKLWAALRSVVSSVDLADGYLAQAKRANPKERAVDNRLDAANSTRGFCWVCTEAGVPTKEHSGLRDDRLVKLSTGERDVSGDLIEPMVDRRCLMAWRDRRATDTWQGAPLIEWDVWLTERKHYLKEKAA